MIILITTSRFPPIIKKKRRKKNNIFFLHHIYIYTSNFLCILLNEIVFKKRIIESVLKSINVKWSVLLANVRLCKQTIICQAIFDPNAYTWKHTYAASIDRIRFVSTKPTINIAKWIGNRMRNDVWWSIRWPPQLFIVYRLRCELRYKCSLTKTNNYRLKEYFLFRNIIFFCNIWITYDSFLIT